MNGLGITFRPMRIEPDGPIIVATFRCFEPSGDSLLLRSNEYLVDRVGSQQFYTTLRGTVAVMCT